MIFWMCIYILGSNEDVPTQCFQDQQDMTISGDIRSKTGSQPHPTSVHRFALVVCCYQQRKMPRRNPAWPKSPAVHSLLGKVERSISRRQGNSLKAQEQSMWITEACPTRANNCDALALVLACERNPWPFAVSHLVENLFASDLIGSVISQIFFTQLILELKRIGRLVSSQPIRLH